MVNEYNLSGIDTGTTKKQIRKIGAKLQPSKLVIRAILLYAGCMQQVKTKSAEFALNLN